MSDTVLLISLLSLTKSIISKVNDSDRYVKVKIHCVREARALWIVLIQGTQKNNQVLLARKLRLFVSPPTTSNLQKKYCIMD